MDGELRKLLATCQTQYEIKALSDAFNREAAGKATILDSILLDRKRKEAGVARPVRAPRQPVTKQSISAAISIIDREQLQFDPSYRPPIKRYPLLPIEKTSLYKPPRTAASQSNESGILGTTAVGIHNPLDKPHSSQVVSIQNDATKEASNAGTGSSEPSVRKRVRRRRGKKSGAAEPTGSPRSQTARGDAEAAGDARREREAEATRTRATCSPSPPPVKRTRPRPTYDGFVDYSDSDPDEHHRAVAAPSDTAKWTESYGCNPEGEAAASAPPGKPAAPISPSAAAAAAAAVTAHTQAATDSTAAAVSAERKPATEATKNVTSHFIDYGKEERESKRAALEAAFRRKVSIDDSEPEDAKPPPPPASPLVRGTHRAAANEGDDVDEEDRSEESESESAGSSAPAARSGPRGRRQLTAAPSARGVIRRRRRGNDDDSLDEESEGETKPIARRRASSRRVSGSPTSPRRNATLVKAEEERKISLLVVDVAKSRAVQTPARAPTDPAQKTAHVSAAPSAEESPAATRQPAVKREAAAPREAPKTLSAKGPRAAAAAAASKQKTAAVAAAPPARPGPTASRGPATADSEEDEDTEDEEEEEDSETDTDVVDDGVATALAKNQTQTTTVAAAVVVTSEMVRRRENATREERAAVDVEARHDRALEATRAAAAAAKKEADRKPGKPQEQTDGAARLPPIKEAQRIAAERKASKEALETKQAAGNKKGGGGSARKDGRGAARLSPPANATAVRSPAGPASARASPDDAPPPPVDSAVSALADRLSRLSRSRSPTPEKAAAPASNPESSEDSRGGSEVESRGENERPSRAVAAAAALPTIAALKKTRFQEGSTPPQAHNPAARSRRRRKKRDLDAYVRALEQIVDSSLQYIIASTGERLGIEQPLTVAKAKEAADQNSKGSKKLKPSVVKKFMDGKYSKKVDDFLASTG